MSIGMGGPSHKIDDAPRPTREGREGDTEPLPVPSSSPVMHRLVQDDLESRLQVGVVRYGQPLQAFNGRRALNDAYEEVLDQAVYLKQAVFEREHGVAAGGDYTTYEQLHGEVVKIIERYLPSLAEKGMAEKMDVWIRGRAKALGWIIDDIRTQSLAPDALSVTFQAVPAHLATKQSFIVGGE